MRFTKEHRLNIPASRFYDLMFDTEFDKKMNLEGMNIANWELLERNVDGATWTQRTRVTPPDNMPGFIKKIVGSSFSYEEKRTHQKGSDSASVEMVPSVMRDKLKMNYRMRVIPDGDNACRRIMDWELEVKIFAVGGQIEKFASGEIEKGTDASAKYYNAHAASWKSGSAS